MSEARRDVHGVAQELSPLQGRSGWNQMAQLLDGSGSIAADETA